MRHVNLFVFLTCWTCSLNISAWTGRTTTKRVLTYLNRVAGETLYTYEVWHYDYSCSVSVDQYGFVSRSQSPGRKMVPIPVKGLLFRSRHDLSAELGLQVLQVLETLTLASGLPAIPRTCVACCEATPKQTIQHLAACTLQLGKICGPKHSCLTGARVGACTV